MRLTKTPAPKASSRDESGSVSAGVKNNQSPLGATRQRRHEVRHFRNCIEPFTLGRMSDFDKLPKALRERLRYADHNWSGTQMLQARRNRKKYPQVAKLQDAIEFVIQSDIKKHRADTTDPTFIGVMPGQR